MSPIQVGTILRLQRGSIVWCFVRLTHRRRSMIVKTKVGKRWIEDILNTYEDQRVKSRG